MSIFARGRSGQQDTVKRLVTYLFWPIRIKGKHNLPTGINEEMTDTKALLSTCQDASLSCSTGPLYQPEYR